MSEVVDDLVRKFGANVALCAIQAPNFGRVDGGWLDGAWLWEAPGIESARVDQWLWSVRMTKTRSDAAAACRGGHVEINGKAAKPATPVKVGDRIEAYLHGRERILEVTRLIVKRVGAGVAVECFVDHSPPPPERERDVPVFERDRGTGRPTKRDKRQLDRLRGRSK
jgi:ribosome-associated heat shock protein Hsp15